VSKKRDFKNKDVLVKEAYRFGALGLNIGDLADVWRISLSGLIRYFKKRPEVKESFEKGKRDARIAVLQSLLEQARKGNIRACELYLEMAKEPDKVLEKEDWSEEFKKLGLKW